jgi:hypothetical protein
MMLVQPKFKIVADFGLTKELRTEHLKGQAAHKRDVANPTWLAPEVISSVVVLTQDRFWRRNLTDFLLMCTPSVSYFGKYTLINFPFPVNFFSFVMLT